MSLLVVGTVAFDAIETPFAKTDKIIGGAATYIALSASNFVDNIHLVSVIGGDFPKETLELFQQKGIDLTGLEIRKNEKSFFWAGKYHQDLNSRDTLITELNVLADFSPIIPEKYQDCEFLMLGNLTPDIQRSVIQQLKQRPKLVVMDTMNYWMNVAWDSLLETLQLVDVLTINDEEARQLSGEFSLYKAALKIQTMGPKFVVIKKGEHGALIFHKDEYFFCPAFLSIDVIDPTGAGDTFAGGFIGYLYQVSKKRYITFEDMKAALVFGSVMASFCVEHLGPHGLFEISTDDIQNRFQQFRKMVTI